MHYDQYQRRYNDRLYLNHGICSSLLEIRRTAGRNTYVASIHSQIFYFFILTPMAKEAFLLDHIGQTPWSNLTEEKLGGKNLLAH